MSNPYCPDMKKLGYSGQSLIVKQFVRLPPPWDGRHHDPWPAHAIGEFHTIGSHNCASGLYVLDGQFTLQSTDSFFYPLMLDTFEKVEATRQFYLDAPFFGENWNFILRPMVFDKVLFADWDAWLAAH